jgi:hypothetical protein
MVTKPFHPGWFLQGSSAPAWGVAYVHHCADCIVAVHICTPPQ